MWKEVKGYKWPYRVSDMGLVQKWRKGKWVDVALFMGKNRVCAKLQREDKRVSVPVKWLVADAYMGGRREGLDIIHLDGSKWNCAAYNLKFSPRHETVRLRANCGRKAIVKIDRNGEVVYMFPSMKEAAKHEFLCTRAIRMRCQGQIKDPYRLNGYTYQYEERIMK